MHGNRSHRTGSRRTRAGQFVLGTLAVVLALVLLVCGLQRLRHHRQQQRLAVDLKTFAAMVTDFRTRNGRLPLRAAELGDALIRAGWRQPTPFGGQYEWIPPRAPGEPGLIALTAFHPQAPLSCTRSDLLAVDRRIDDGNLNGGRFRTGFNGWPVLAVSAPP